MTDHDIHGCGSAGSAVAVLCAGLGVATAVGMLKALNLTWYVGIFPPSNEVGAGVIVLFVTAVYLGMKEGMFLCEKRDGLALHVLVGNGVAFGSIAIAVFAGTLVHFVREWNRIVNAPGGFTVWHLIAGAIGNLLLILLFGGIPAILLGVLYGFLVRSGLRMLER